VPSPVAALEVDDLVVRFSGTTVLDHLSLRAERGAVTALLGPNGAGKTTLIRCCTGIVTPDDGTVRVLDRSVADACAAGRVGLMPQSAGAWSGIRPLELLRYLASLHAHPLPVGPLAERLGLDAFAGTPYRRLSGGQQQAVNLAGALVGRPELVFLDEPTAGMDPHARRSVWRLVGDLRDAGVSVLLTTHLMAEAAELADRIWIIDHGRICLSGTLAELTAGGATLEEVFLTHTDDRMRP